jgi:hypothetical protein
MSEYANIVTKEAGARELPAELDPKGEGLVYGGSATHCWGALNKIALQIHVAPLQTFEWEETFDESEDEDEPADTGPWHDPADGLRTVSGLLQFLRQGRPDQLKAHFTDEFIQQNLEWVIFDLRAYEMILTEARTQNDPFRVLIC